MARPLYRAGQFFRGLWPAIGADEAESVRRLLTDAELHLFLTLDARDRRQAADMVRWLKRNAPQPSDTLLVAALLHDVGKSGLWVWDRVLFVLLEAISPALVDGLAGEPGEPGDGRGRWRRALWTLRHHAALGAERLSAIETRPRVVALVAVHAGGAEESAGDAADAELRWLIAAGEAC